MYVYMPMHSRVTKFTKSNSWKFPRSTTAPFKDMKSTKHTNHNILKTSGLSQTNWTTDRGQVSRHLQKNLAFGLESLSRNIILVGESDINYG